MDVSLVYAVANKLSENYMYTVLQPFNGPPCKVLSSSDWSLMVGLDS